MSTLFIPETLHNFTIARYIELYLKRIGANLLTDTCLSPLNHKRLKCAIEQDITVIYYIFV